MKLLLSLVLFSAIGHSISEKVRYDNYKLYKVTPKNAPALQALKELEEATFSGYNFWSPVAIVGVPVDIMVPPNRVKEFETIVNTLDMDSQILMGNVQDQIDAEDGPRTRDGSFGWTHYHTLDEINAWLRNLSTVYAPVVSLIEGGRSYEGRIIYGVKVSYSPNNVNNSVFLESNIHSNEWITSAVETYILNELLTSTDETVRRVAESHDWYVFPVFNPDGFNYAHTTDRLWRKTRTPHSILCQGADPNRNWDYKWNHGGTSNSPCANNYRGPHAFSEPCARSLSQFIGSIAHQLVAYINFHSYMQLLLLPYGYTSGHFDNYEEMYQIGRKSIEALARRYGTHYIVGTVYDTIYPTSGSTVDYMKGVYNIPIAYSYELRDRGRFGFLLPADQILPTAEETLDSIIEIFVEYANSNNNK